MAEPLETLRWRGAADGASVPGALELVDQRALPLRVETLRCEDVEAAWEAIRALAVRGAPAIGVAAAYGVVLGAQAARGDLADVRGAALAAAERLATSRPTAVNLFWALDRMRHAAEGFATSGHALLVALLAEARAIHDEDRAMCRAIGAHGARLLPDPARVLTHCNAGGLATAEHGTALGVIYSAVAAGKRVEVLACETRPLLQGARLTAFELRARGVPVTLLTDGMAAFAMQRGRVDAVIVGADRIARNGDVANKIGTYAHAVAARRHGLPFYVAAPSSTFDLSLEGGGSIPIEERAPEEVTTFAGVRTAPEDVAVWNPAFDVTPAELVTAVITERGVISPVTEDALLAVLGRG